MRRGTPTGQCQLWQCQRLLVRQGPGINRPPATYPPSSLFKAGPTVSGKKTASVMKDGTKLCPDFQTGKCKSAKCNKGAHRWQLSAGQRVCGSPGHGASECRANTKAAPGRGRDPPCISQPTAHPLRGSPALSGGSDVLPRRSSSADGAAVDWVLDPSHDLSAPACQELVKSYVAEAVLVVGALDCSTKSRAREIHRGLPSGRQLPKPLRSEQHPMGAWAGHRRPAPGFQEQCGLRLHI